MKPNKVAQETSFKWVPLRKDLMSYTRGTYFEDVTRTQIQKATMDVIKGLSGEMRLAVAAMVEVEEGVL